MSVPSCAVCLENFNENDRCPRIMPCGHSICHACALSLMSTKCCPNCRRTFHASRAEDLPKNWTVLDMLGTDQQPSLSAAGPADTSASQISAKESSVAQILSQTAVVRRTPPDGHTHTKLRAVPSESRDLSVMVRPIVEVCDGDEVQLLASPGPFCKVRYRGVEGFLKASYLTVKPAA